jgi:hypothetical protein
MNPEQAKTQEEVEAKVQMWKTDVRILLECGQDQDQNMVQNEDQMITILLSILPDKIVEQIMSKYDVGMTSLDEMEEKLREYMDKIGDNQHRSKAVKKVSQVKVNTDDCNHQEEDEWTQYWDQEYGNFWLKTATKRQRTEEAGEDKDARAEEAEGVNGPGKAAKGKGKGKGGPKGGCHECGGPHFVRDCPVRQQRKGGKGKGGKGWESVQPRYWNAWNPGFINRQWSSWRPGGYNPKGKGKGKGGFQSTFGGKGEGAQGMDVNKLTFPPLCSVENSSTNYYGPESEDWGSDEQSKSNEWTAESGIWLGLNAVCKKKSLSYSKTQDFDAAIHQSKCWKGQEESMFRDERNKIEDISRQGHAIQVPVSRSADRRVPSATFVRCGGFEHCNTFEALQDEEEEDDDRCVECNFVQSTCPASQTSSCGWNKERAALHRRHSQESEEKEEKKEVLKQIRTLQKAVKKEKTVAACNEKKKGWQCLSLAVDSGACDNVIDPGDICAYEDRVEETEASKNQENFIAANGEEIPNYGQVRVPAITREKTVRGITFQAAGVSKGLLSVEKMNECGHLVVFDGDASFIANKKTGEVNRMRRQDGNFMLDLWIPPPEVAQSLGFAGRP